MINNDLTQINIIDYGFTCTKIDFVENNQIVSFSSYFRSESDNETCNPFFADIMFFIGMLYRTRNSQLNNHPELNKTDKILSSIRELFDDKIDEYVVKITDKGNMYVKLQTIEPPFVTSEKLTQFMRNITGDQNFTFVKLDNKNIYDNCRKKLSLLNYEKIKIDYCKLKR